MGMGREREEAGQEERSVGVHQKKIHISKLQYMPLEPSHVETSRNALGNQWRRSTSSEWAGLTQLSGSAHSPQMCEGGFLSQHSIWFDAFLINQTQIRPLR